MQLVSDNYKNSMKGLVRNQSFIKIGFSIVDQEASGNVTLQANSHETYSDLENTNDGYDVTQTYITMEQGRYKIGTDQVIYDNTNYLTQGYVSSVVADGNGEFTNNPIITITSAIPLSTLGFTFDFDMVCKEAPKEIRLKAYLESILVSDRVFTINSSIASLEQPIEAWDKVEVEFTKVLPYHRARLDSIVFGITKTFENDMVLNATMTRQCSPISNEIAQNSFSFEIDNFNQSYNPDNPSNIYKYVEEEQEIKVDFGYELNNGKIEWVNGGKYVLDGMPTINPNSVKFNAVDTLGDLTDIFYKGMYRETPISMYDLATEVLVDAGLKTTEYVLDDYMKTVFTKAPLPIVTHKECLQIIANACQCLLFVNRDGQITFDVAIDPTITISDNGGISISSSALAYNSPHLITDTVITMEKDFWQVGNNMVILDDYEESEIKHGFISASLSKEDGTFDVNPQIYVEYSSGVSLYEIPIVFGGTVYDFNVYYYSKDTLLDTYSITNNEELTHTIYNQQDEVTKVVYEVVRVKPLQRARINGIGTGRVSDFYLDFNTSKSVPIVKKQQPLYAVDVKCYSWNVGENKELFKETISVNGSITLKVEYNPSINIVVNASSGFSVESQIFTRYGVIILTGTGECELVITGDELVESNMVVSNVVGLKGETKTLENPLITDTANAQLTAKWIAEWLTKRNEYDIEYRGNVEVDAYDMIYAQSQFEEYFPVRVVKNEVTFNGALSGKLNARRT